MAKACSSRLMLHSSLASRSSRAPSDDSANPYRSSHARSTSECEDYLRAGSRTDQFRALNRSKLPRPADGRHGAMRNLIYGMNLTLDGYVAAPGDDLGWSGPSDELFQWWLDQERRSAC